MRKFFFKSVEIKIAVFAIVGFFLLFWGVNFLKGIDIFKKQYPYYVIFENTSGLMPSHFVTINGLNVGIVENIELMSHRSNRLLVTLNIDKEINIPINSTAKITSSNPLSSPQVEIVFSKENQYIQAGDTIQAEVVAGLLDGLSGLGNIISNIDTIIAATKQKIVLSGALDSLKYAIEDFHSITKNLDNILKQNSHKIDNAMSDLESFTAMLHKNNNKIEQIIEKISSVSSDLAEAEIKPAIDSLSMTVGHLQKFMNGS